MTGSVGSHLLISRHIPPTYRQCRGNREERPAAIFRQLREMQKVTSAPVEQAIDVLGLTG